MALCCSDAGAGSPGGQEEAAAGSRGSQEGELLSLDKPHSRAQKLMGSPLLSSSFQISLNWWAGAFTSVLSIKVHSLSFIHSPFH